MPLERSTACDTISQTTQRIANAAHQRTHGSRMSELRWCVVQTKPREEEIAVANLRNQAFDVFMPLLRDQRRLETKIVAMFPGYLFVAIDPTTLSWLPIVSTRGVRHLMTIRPEQPSLLPRGWVEDLRRRGVIDLFTDALSFRKGDHLEF